MMTAIGDQRSGVRRQPFTDDSEQAFSHRLGHPRVHPVGDDIVELAEVFAHADQIDMKSEETEKWVKVTETSDDPYVAKLIQKHAEVVSLFLKNGHAEVRKNHSLPERSSS